MKLRTVILVATAMTAALAIAFPRIIECWELPLPENAYFAVYIPAVALAFFAWMRHPGLTRSWPFLFAMAVPVFGLFYSQSPSVTTNLVITFYLLGGVFLSALIRDAHHWRLVARTFVFFNAVLVVLILYLNYRLFSGSVFNTFIKFGYIPLKTGYPSANPNQLGGQLAFASILGLIVFLRSGRLIQPLRSQTSELPGRGLSWNPATVYTPFPQSAGRGPAVLRIDHHLEPSEPGVPARFQFGRADWLILIFALLSAAGCLLTGSRGAILAMLISGIAIFFNSVGLQPIRRIQDFIVFGLFSILLGCLLAATLEFNPFVRLFDRLSRPADESWVVLGHRLPIWENVFLVWTSDPLVFLIGSGTGGADVTLGTIDPGATFNEEGLLRRNCHNLFLEWLLSFGLVGSLPGLVLASTIWGQATALDHQERAFDRRGLLILIVAFGMTAVTYRHLNWLIQAGLVLALLEGQHQVPPPHPARHPHFARQTPATLLKPAAFQNYAASHPDLHVPSKRRNF